MIILITASLSSKRIQQSFLMRRFDVGGNKINIVSDHQYFHEFSFALEISSGLPVLDHSDGVFPSKNNPASKEMISDSVELCETEVCFLHIQLIGTNV